MSKKVTLTEIKKHYAVCFECASKAGGKIPPKHICTVWQDKCPICGEDATMIPWVDFDWKDDDKATAVAKMCRD